MARMFDIGPIAPAGQSSAKVVSNNGPVDLNAPANIDTSYQFGDWLSGASAAKQQAAAQAQMDALEFQRNEYSAQQQRAFEKEMDSTKVQRSMADLKAAGLNPWLAVQSAGFGGSTPSGATASSSAGQVQASGSGGQALSSLGMTAFGIAALIKTVAKFIK